MACLRLLINAPPVFDLASGNVSTGLWIDTGGLAGNTTGQIGAITLPSGNKEMHLQKITGQLNGATVAPDSAYLNGLVINMINNQTGPLDTGNDPARVRGIIGTVTTNDTGSVRAIHFTVVGVAGGAINGTLMQMQPSASSFVSRGFLVETVGASNKTEGFYMYSGVGQAAKFGLATYDCEFIDSAIVMKTGITNGKIRWTNGGYISSREAGGVEQGGPLRKLNGEALNWRNASDTGDVEVMQVDAFNRLKLGFGTTDIQWGKALVALGGGAAPTLGTIGGSGPAAAAQNTWLRLIDSTGAACYVPVWK